MFILPVAIISMIVALSVNHSADVVPLQLPAPYTELGGRAYESSVEGEAQVYIPPAGGKVFAFRGPLTPQVGSVLLSALEDAYFPTEAGAEVLHHALYIDSPGGVAGLGIDLFHMIRRIVASGGKLDCIAGREVMSAAFLAYTACEPGRRVALPNTQFLWHPIKMNFQGSANIHHLEVSAYELHKLQEFYDSSIKRVLRISDSVYNTHLVRETMHSPAGLNKLSPGFSQVVAGYRGVKVYFPAPGGIFGGG